MNIQTMYIGRGERGMHKTNGVIKAKGRSSYKKEGTAVAKYRKTAFFALQ